MSVFRCCIPLLIKTLHQRRELFAHKLETTTAARHTTINHLYQPSASAI